MSTITTLPPDTRPVHDELVAEALRSWERFLKVRPTGFPTEAHLGWSIEVESPIGRGCWADLCITGTLYQDPIKMQLSPTAQLTILVEVKTEREPWSAGSVIRQLKRYRGAVLETDAERSVPLVLFTGRDLTDHERELLCNEGIWVFYAERVKRLSGPEVKELAIRTAERMAIDAGGGLQIDLITRRSVAALHEVTERAQAKQGD